MEDHWQLRNGWVVGLVSQGEMWRGAERACSHRQSGDLNTGSVDEPVERGVTVLYWKMSNIWFPVPVALFFRRVVNLLSTISITHHYLLPSRSSDQSLPGLESERAGKVWSQQDYVTWRMIMENGWDSILQGV